MPIRPKWSGSPMPESCRICGEPMAPPARMTSRRVDPLDPVATRIFNADRPRAVEQDAVDQRVGEELKVRPLQCRTQIGARRALPAPPAPGLLNPADIVPRARRQAVDVLVIFEPDLGTGLDQLVAQERLVGGPRRQERPAPAMKLVGLTLPTLGLFEKGQDIVPRPTTIAELGPMVEIFRLTANVNQPVDRAGAAEHPAARVEHGARPLTPGSGSALNPQVRVG